MFLFHVKRERAEILFHVKHRRFWSNFLSLMFHVKQFLVIVCVESVCTYLGVLVEGFACFSLILGSLRRFELHAGLNTGYLFLLDEWRADDGTAGLDWRVWLVGARRACQYERLRKYIEKRFCIFYCFETVIGCVIALYD